MGARPLCGRPLSGAGPLGFCPQFREDGAVSREGRLWPGPRGLGRMRTGSPAPNCLCFASPLNDQPLPPAPVTSAWLPPFLLHVTVTCGDPQSSVSSLCSQTVQAGMPLSRWQWRSYRRKTDC